MWSTVRIWQNKKTFAPERCEEEKQSGWKKLQLLETTDERQEMENIIRGILHCFFIQELQDYYDLTSECWSDICLLLLWLMSDWMTEELLHQCVVLLWAACRTFLCFLIKHRASRTLPSSSLRPPAVYWAIIIICRFRHRGDAKCVCAPVYVWTHKLNLFNAAADLKATLLTG